MPSPDTAPQLVTTRVGLAATAGSAEGQRWRRRFQVAAGALVVALAVGAWGWILAHAASQRPVTRSYISLGDSVQLQTGIAQVLALSPDGTRLAFVGDTLGRIWVKSIGELNPVLIPGTEHSSDPTFSPDGQWIAFVGDGHLKKVRAEGGASITLADSVAPGFGGATWLDDGTLVYVPTSLLGLRRVGANGGGVTVALADPTLGGLGIGSPTALPRARGVLFQACSSGCVTMGLRVLDLKTGKQKLLFNDAAIGWYLPTGELFYVRRDGVGLVAPFDLGKLEVTGPSVPVLAGTAETQSIVQLAWSRSGRLIYEVGGSNNDIVTLERVTRSGAATPIDSSWSGQLNSFSISPNERRVAVGATTSGAGLNIWIKQLDKGPFTRLTFSARDRRPTWSPDGTEVAFIRDSGVGGDVYARPVDGGGGDRLLAHLDRAIQEVTWSHDGRWIVVRTDNGAAGNGDILAVPASGSGPPIQLAAAPQFSELHPALSPDGRWLAYSSNEAGQFEVYVRPFPNAGAGRWQVSNGGGGQPVWSSDGRELFFLDANFRMTEAEIRTTPGFTVPALHPLFDASRFAIDLYHQSFAVLKDGRFVFAGQPRSGVATPPKLVEIDNWFADIKAKIAE